MASVATIQKLLAVFIVIQNVYATKDYDLNLGLNGDGGDDLLASFGSMIDSLSGSLGDNKDCTFRCPKANQVSKPREGHNPTSNGCGSYGMVLNTEKLPKMTKCCDRHDICYGTCNTNKDSCDRIFKQCLEDMCTDLSGSLSQDEYEGCEATAELMYQGTVALGCGSFIQSQKDACECVTSSSKKTPSKQSENAKSSKRGDL
ncbi:group XIIA secretory phospholipase A2-like [Ylistrum balloti]|uniref:group XIIA secretory phospholipase A2-like n=1 Tax=Ylistrum balloti TaxID=509963 RepID=UPI002905A3EF|nr:group XIIA secretory phospholipase A2-like [Ylistrum balloti]